MILVDKSYIAKSLQEKNFKLLHFLYLIDRC